MHGVSGKVLGPQEVEFLDAEEDLLDRIYDPGPGRRFCAAAMVGAGGNNSDRTGSVVGGVPERVVLKGERVKCKGQDY